MTDRLGPGVENFEDIKLAEPFEWRRVDCRVVIASHVGLNHDPRIRFGLRHLNSIFAFIEGEHFYSKRFYETPMSPDPGRVRAAIAEVIGMPHFSEDDTREFRADELRQLALAVMNRRDERPAPKKRQTA